MSKLGDFVAKKRKEKRITVRAFAEKTGLSLGYIGYLENGQRYPTSPDVHLKIADALDLSQEERKYFFDMIAEEKDWIHSDISIYLENSKMAQTALRTAEKNNISDSEWERIIQIIKEGEKN